MIQLVVVFGPANKLKIQYIIINNPNMEFVKMLPEGNLAEGYAMEVLFRDHHVALFCVSLGSLILGLPLAWNALWHLQERFSNPK